VSERLKNSTRHIGLVQRGHHHHLIEMYFVLAMKNCSLGIKQQSLTPSYIFEQVFSVYLNEPLVYALFSGDIMLMYISFVSFQTCKRHHITE